MVNLIYDLLFGAPLTLTVQLLEKLRDEIDRERLVTEDSIRERLQQLQIALQDGELNETEYEELEDLLIKRLRAVRELQNQRRSANGTAS